MSNHGVLDGGGGNAEEIVGVANDGPKLIRRVLVTSYIITDGQVWRINHQDGCINTGKDEMWNRAIQQGASKTISELNTLLRLLFGMSGCTNCGIDKETTVGVLFNHSQDSTFVPTQVSGNDTYMSMVSPRESAPSWRESDFVGTLAESERARYRKFRWTALRTRATNQGTRNHWKTGTMDKSTYP